MTMYSPDHPTITGKGVDLLTVEAVARALAPRPPVAPLFFPPVSEAPVEYRAENDNQLWTAEEDEWLRQNYSTRGSLACSEHLKRTQRAVRRRAHLLRRWNRTTDGDTLPPQPVLWFPSLSEAFKAGYWARKNRVGKNVSDQFVPATPDEVEEWRHGWDVADVDLTNPG